MVLVICIERLLKLNDVSLGACVCICDYIGLLAGLPCLSGLPVFSAEAHAWTLLAAVDLTIAIVVGRGKPSKLPQTKRCKHTPSLGLCVRGGRRLLMGRPKAGERGLNVWVECLVVLMVEWLVCLSVAWLIGLFVGW